MIIFANLPDGLQNMSLFDQAFAAASAGQLGEPAIVTGSSATILPGIAPLGTPIVFIRRTAPTLTTLYFPNLLLQDQIPIIIKDWSDSVTDHEIRCLPFGAPQTIEKAASYSLWSNSSSLAGAKFNPTVDLLSWYIAP